MILYLAGPMSGLPGLNYPAFTTAASLLREVGYDVLNPVDSESLNPTPGVAQHWSWYMRHAIAMVVKAEGMALLPGWDASKGATLEHHIARSLDIPSGPVMQWLAAAL